MKKIVVLDGKTLGNVDYIKLNEFGQVVYYDLTLKEEVAERIKDANIVLTNKVALNEDNLKEASELELICEMATGFNNIDIKYCKEKNITVTNVSGYSTTTVAQHTFAMLLHLYDNISYFDHFVKSGEYSKHNMFTNIEVPYRDLCGKVWGIVGLGNIGKRVARIAQAFGARVVYYSTSGKNADSDYARVEFESLLKQCDIISIHAPLNEKTEGLFNYEAFTKMRKDAVLINVGRGPIVVDEDLSRALDEEIIGGAALDVFKVEPIPGDNPLLKIKNKERLVLTPHIAWASEEARNRLFADLLENISAFNRGEKRNRV
ncbi:glycerate dehydrogenase [Clostridium saccharoperbutylacetonicum]|jgi:glycerate dehydrogenase|uniref:Lactate dehydrogenase-like oxidoreductase n=1 Tax=Clostridium saccharoperbutylacetonicum N1-4(HMT) TaxID=931276 RepID=M1MEH7_9CLOT|nr:D-2-hydroxyacid dehydrogenase [Clostridium saccharoperbutylacetonicum]AGF54758.1 lactate dehydrogenase-like oxidoreductase [Clostridium saccharoperbutylacetonicum N1-4(HMT)]NRT58721.1 glycerate dehydrogenase [Clostridium saccharoperbutylacetonicum]NSB27910.1 glycerate dehydrogenase [Clostridium saccharoperbutylacetonicum]NSB41393.1 glycerate dehydrogenase [Clostridium saccharoperbutylacetonicum]